MLSTIMGAVLTTAATDVAGRITGHARVSMTKASTGAGTLAGAWALVPLALQGDETAIGALVVMAVTYVGVLRGRWRAEQA